MLESRDQNLGVPIVWLAGPSTVLFRRGSVVGGLEQVGKRKCMESGFEKPSIGEDDFPETQWVSDEAGCVDVEEVPIGEDAVEVTMAVEGGDHGGAIAQGCHEPIRILNQTFGLALIR